MRALPLILLAAISLSVSTVLAEPRTDAECWAEARDVAGDDKGSLEYREALNACVLGITPAVRERKVIIIDENPEPSVAVWTVPQAHGSAGKWVRVSPHLWVRR